MIPPLDRADLERREDAWLAPYAMRACESRGRDHGTDEDSARTAFQRDRDRIVHSKAFRRLAYKTQVFINDSGDLFRTRLTHTIEVAQLARSAARRLSLNEDLVECIALAHDLGHPPFGHRGESMLAELMADHGGFEHNQQTLRIVEVLESRYPDFQGLDLTYEVREGIVKHHADGIPNRYHPEERPLLEAILVDAIDSIAYDCHDLDDGLRSGIITADALSEVPLWSEMYRQVGIGLPQNLAIDRCIRGLIDLLLGDLVGTSFAAIQTANLTSTAQVRSIPLVCIRHSDGIAKQKRDLESWLFAHLYRNPDLNLVFDTARNQLADIFRALIANPSHLPEDFQARAAIDGLYRCVADYVAGMTDRYALGIHPRLSG